MSNYQLIVDKNKLKNNPLQCYIFDGLHSVLDKEVNIKIG